MDLNKVQIIGRLTRDPEMRTIPSGENVATFSVATGFQWKDAQGTRQERTEFHNVVAWRRLAEIVGQYLKKGSKVYIEGRLQTRSWDDQNGVKKYRTEIVADNMIMLDSKGASSGASSAAAAQPSEAQAKQPAPAQGPAQPQPGAATPAADDEISIEDIPF